MPQVLFEKRVDSFPSLAKELELLDMDSGIRTFGDYLGKKRQFVFVTRSPHDSYVVMVYERKAKPAVAGRRLLAKEFETGEELKEFMRTLVSRPVRAFVY